MEGLSPNTTYHVRAYAIVDNNISYGNEIVFTTTPPQVPTVETVSASCGYFEGFGLYNWDATGKIISDGGANVNYNKVGFVISKYPNPTWNGGNYDNDLYWEGNMQGIGREFTSYARPGELLDLNTTYYIRAFAVNSVGVGYGDIIQMTTGGMPSATIETFPVTEITRNSAVCSGQVVTSGMIGSMGICWGTSPNPETVFGGGNNAIEVPSTTNVFTVTLTGLTPNTTYYVRTFAFGEFEGSYGENQVFTTLP